MMAAAIRGEVDPQEHKRIYTAEWRAARRAAAIEKLGGKCAQCGTRKRLEFDHIDPATKRARISKLWTASKKIFDAELAKCQLLCYGCHKAKTYTDGSFGEWGKR